MTPEQIDRDEQKRVKGVLAKAREYRRDHSITIAKGRGIYGRDRDRGRMFSLNLGTHALGLTPDGIADLIQKKIRARAEAEYFKSQAQCISHVKDGKPLTEYGAKMLGVLWPPA
jgi:hypothetical protein